MTLNLNELKRLAEEATSGPWADCLTGIQIRVNPATILALIERIQEAETRNALQQRALDSIRNEALEEAAEICETAPDYLQDSSFDGAARAIRALKSATRGEGDL